MTTDDYSGLERFAEVDATGEDALFISFNEIDLHIAPVLLGDGIRLFDNPGGAPVRLELRNGDDPTAAVNVRYHPVATR